MNDDIEIVRRDGKPDVVSAESLYSEEEIVARKEAAAEVVAELDRPRGADRRVAVPRREAERHLHYAEQAVLAAALAYSRTCTELDATLPEEDALLRMEHAAHDYRDALEKVQ